MKVAVLMSSYNGEKYIEGQIESILKQKGNFRLELWVRDDGSTDDTQTILQNYAKAGKLKWYTGTNMGPARSFLDLVKCCEGYDYYAFADQDDYWLPNKLEKAVEVLKSKKGINVYFSNAELVDSRLEFFGRNVYKQNPKLDFKTLTCAGGILGCTTVFNKELAIAIQNKPLPCKMVMHDFYVCELCEALDGTITFDEKAYMKYRQHQNNVVGISLDVFGTIRGRAKSIVQKPKVSISEQAEEILNLYHEEITNAKREWLVKIANYRKNIFNRIRLAGSSETKYINRNMSLKLRLSILLGNR